ncbi:hypothetical protein RQP46_003259 [Phenoliferia psychrophenolica]
MTASWSGSPDLDDSYSSSSSSSFDRSSFSSQASATTSAGGPHDTPLSSPNPFARPAYSSYSEVDFYPPAAAPLAIQQPPPSPPLQRVSALATFAAEQIVYLWFAAPTGRPTKHQLLPTERFLRFCDSLLATTQISHSVVLLALLFIHRLKASNSINGAPGSEHRLTVTALMLANKILDDNTYTAKTWSDVSSLELKALVAAEVEFLQGLSWRLNVSEREFRGWVKLLEGHVAARREHLSESRSARRGKESNEGTNGLPGHGLGLGGNSFAVDHAFLRDGRRHSRGGVDAVRPRGASRPPTSLSTFAFPPTSSFETSMTRSYHPPPSAPSHSNPYSPLSTSTSPDGAFATPVRTRLPSVPHHSSHARSLSYAPHPYAPAPSSAPPKRSAAAADLDPSPPALKRLAPAATWLSRSFSAGASPAPPRSVYVLPRGPVYIHSGHRLASEDLSPTPPTPRRDSYYSPADEQESGFRHLANGRQSRLATYKPESLAFYSLAAGQRLGVPRWTSTDPSFQTQPTPTTTPGPLYAAAFAPSEQQYEYWDEHRPTYAPPPIAPQQLQNPPPPTLSHPSAPTAATITSSYDLFELTLDHDPDGALKRTQPELLSPHEPAFAFGDDLSLPASPPLVPTDDDLAFATDLTSPAASLGLARSAAGMGMHSAAHPSLEMSADLAVACKTLDDHVFIKQEEDTGPAFDIDQADDLLARYTNCEDLVSPPATQPDSSCAAAPSSPYPSFTNLFANLPPLPSISGAPLQLTYSETHAGNAAAFARAFDGALESPLDESPLASPYTSSDFGSSPQWASVSATPDMGAFNSLSLDQGPDSQSWSYAVPLFAPTSSSQGTVIAQYQDQGEEQDLIVVKQENDLFGEDELFGGGAEHTEAEPEAEDTKDDEYSPPAPKRATRKRKAPATPSATSGPRDKATGKRVYNGSRNVELLDTTAPIQKRQYTGPSATSRKPIPKAMIKAVRARLSADLNLAVADPAQIDPVVADFIDSKRQQNTLSARQSRLRKAERLAYLEERSEELDELKVSYGELEEENTRLHKKLRLAGIDE